MLSENKNMRKIYLLVAFAIAFYFLVNNYLIVFNVLGYIYSLFFPFILGGCIAFIINIPMSYFMKKILQIRDTKIGGFLYKGSNIISLLISYVMVIGIITLIISLVIPQITETTKLLPYAFQNASLSLQKWADNSKWLSDEVADIIKGMQINWLTIFDNIKGSIFNGAGSFISSTINVATSFANGLVNFSLGLIFSIYVLLQKEKLGNQGKKIIYAYLSKQRADAVLEIAQLTNRTFSKFLTGQCVEAVILGLLFFISMSIFRFPYALVISVLLAVTALIPVFGAFIGCAVGIFLIVMVDPLKAVLFLVLFLILQQIEGNLIYPRVVGNSVGLPSIWVLVAITIGAKTMGVAGMLIFIPLCSVAYVLFRRAVYERLEKREIRI